MCLNILREDWKPVLSINSIIYGLQFLFMVSCMPRILIGQSHVLWARQSERLCAIAMARKPGAIVFLLLLCRTPILRTP